MGREFKSSQVTHYPEHEPDYIKIVKAACGHDMKIFIKPGHPASHRLDLARLKTCYNCLVKTQKERTGVK